MVITVTPAQRAAVAARAKYLGLYHAPYRFGGTNKTGIDCSGLALEAWKEAGVSLPHNTVDIVRELGQVVPTEDNINRLVPGDLVWFKGEGPDGKPGTTSAPQHVAVFVEKHESLYVIAQATDIEHGSELVKLRKYGNPSGLTFMGH